MAIEFPLSLLFWNQMLLSASPQVPGWVSGLPLPFLQRIHPSREQRCSELRSVCCSRCGLTSTEQNNCFSWPIGWFLPNASQYYHNLWLQGCTAGLYLISALQALESFSADLHWVPVQMSGLGFWHSWSSCIWWLLLPHFQLTKGPFERLACSPEYPSITPPGLVLCVKLLRVLSWSLKMLNGVVQMLFQIPFSPQTYFRKNNNSEWWNVNYWELAHIKISLFMCQYCLLGTSKIISKTRYCLHGVCVHSFKWRDHLMIFLGIKDINIYKYIF